MRGDEPFVPQSLTDTREIRPTCVGMNRCSAASTATVTHIRPTCVGMNRTSRLVYLCLQNIRPTCVGMNRGTSAAAWSTPMHPPHVRGGEWHNLRNRRASIEIRPTCVGMNASGQGITAPTDDSLLS